MNAPQKFGEFVINLIIPVDVASNMLYNCLPTAFQLKGFAFCLVRFIVDFMIWLFCTDMMEFNKQIYFIKYIF